MFQPLTFYGFVSLGNPLALGMFLIVLRLPRNAGAHSVPVFSNTSPRRPTVCCLTHVSRFGTRGRIGTPFACGFTSGFSLLLPYVSSLTPLGIWVGYLLERARSLFSTLDSLPSFWLYYTIRVLVLSSPFVRKPQLFFCRPAAPRPPPMRGKTAGGSARRRWRR